MNRLTPIFKPNSEQAWYADMWWDQIYPRSVEAWKSAEEGLPDFNISATLIEEVVDRMDGGPLVRREKVALQVSEKDEPRRKIFHTVELT